MDANELDKVSDYIWSTLNLIENKNKTKDEQINLIKPILIKLSFESRTVGRKQILNYFKDEISNLES